jgi:hypothetical protein
MQKVLLMSILAATMAIAVFAARAGSLKQAVRRSAMATVVFCICYWLGLMYVYPLLPASNTSADTTAR